MDIETLRKELKNIFKGKTFDGINTDFDKYLIKNGVGFFPYGSGLLTTKKEIPKGSFLFLGSDFGSTNSILKAIEKGEAKNPTYRNLNEIIDDEHKERVFLSNVYMGLRDKVKSTIEEVTIYNNEEYQQLSKTFLEFQINHIKPLKIITLGVKPEKFIRENLEYIETLNIPHPYSWFNIKNNKTFRSKDDIKGKIFNN